LRIGLLFGSMLGNRADGSTPSVAEAAQVLLDAAAWLDAEARAEDWPAWEAAQLEWSKDMVVPRATEEEQAESRAVCEVLVATERATEVAAVSEAVVAATDVWRSLRGVDLITATDSQLAELDRLQEAATLEGRSRADRILSTRPEWA